VLEAISFLVLLVATAVKETGGAVLPFGGFIADAKLIGPAESPVTA